MDESTLTLDLLSELSDADQELFHQWDRKAFTLFPKLPIELRLRIWKFTFPPGREIFLGKYQLREEIHRALPIALRVSQESRSIALEQYTIIPEWWWGYHLFKTSVKEVCKPLVFHPIRDKFFLDYDDLMRGKLEDLYLAMQEGRQGRIERIQILKVELLWGDDIAKELHYLGANPHTYLVTELLNLTGLKHLYIHITTHYSEFSSDRSPEELEEAFRQILEVHKARFAAGKVPIIKVTKGRRP